MEKSNKVQTSGHCKDDNEPIWFSGRFIIDSIFLTRFTEIYSKRQNDFIFIYLEKIYDKVRKFFAKSLRQNNKHIKSNM